MKQRKLKLFCLTIMLLLGMCGCFKLIAQASDSEEKQDGDYTYVVKSDDTIEITNYLGSESNVEIPSTLAGKSVTNIGSYAFEECNSIKSITIPNSVKSIKYGAFLSCVNLETVKLPDNIEVLSGSTFFYCTSLREITIPASVTFIGSAIFEACYSLEYINYSGTKEQWNSIEIDPEDGSLPLMEIRCNNGIINKNYKTNSYKYVVLQNDTVKILNYIGSPVNVEIPSMLQGKSVTSINPYAFRGCESLQSISIPKSVTDIGWDAFEDCDNLTYINYGGTRLEWEAIETHGSYFKNIPIYCSDGSLNEIKQTDDYKYIINIDDTVDIIRGISDSENIKIESTLDGNPVTTIRESAFEGCDNLKSITIPSTVKTIGRDAFYQCESLTSVTYTGTKKEWKAIEIGYWNDSLTESEIHCSDGILNERKQNDSYKYTIKADDTVEITKYIGKSIDVKIPDKLDGKSVTKIGRYAFYNRDDLKTLTISDNVTNIEYSAFKNCINLQTVKLSNNLQNIESFAFLECGSLTEIMLPKSISWLGMSIFDECESLSYINYAGTMAQWKNIEINEDDICLEKMDIHCSDGMIAKREYTHTFDDGKITVKPTCTTNGKRVYTCINCGETKEEVIKATGHKFGNNQPKCSVCGTKNPNYKETVANPSATTLKSVKAATKSLKVTWTKVSNVDGYQVQYTTDSKFKKSVKTVTVKGQKVTSYTISNLKANQKYYVRVCTYKKKLTSKWSSVKNATTPVQKPAATTLKSVNAGKKSIKVAWKKTSKVNGYQILVATNNKFTKNTKTITITKQSTVSKNITSLKAKSKYYVKVRTYDVQTVNGKKMNVYSDWSKVKTVTTK